MNKSDVSVIDASKDVIVELLETVTCGVKAVHNIAKSAEQGTAAILNFNNFLLATFTVNYEIYLLAATVLNY